jgi:preprotein translocase subunit SecY
MNFAALNFSAWRFLWSAQDIRRKLLMTLAILAIYRLAAHIPVPGANREVIAQILAEGGAAGTLFNLLDLLSGGTVSNFSVLAMGVYPYITSQIILQLLVPIIPALQKRMQEDPREGRKWMEKWTYLLAVPMAALQAIGQINLFTTFAGGVPVVERFGFAGPTLIPSITIILSMTAGTMFAIWLGELISEYGIRKQGLSLIIFAGIVSRAPVTIAAIMADAQFRWISLAFMILFTTLTIFAIVVVQQGQRNVPVMYPGRRMGNRMSMPVKGTLPLRVNMAGMIPIIFAQSLLTFPAILASFFTGAQTPWVANIALSIQNAFGGVGAPYYIMFFLMVVSFTFFYTDVLFSQQNYGENLKKVGAQIPGVSRGSPTQKYLTKVLRRITFPGAVFLGFVAILPWLISLVVPFGRGTDLLFVGSVGLLISVGVIRDTFYNLQAELKLHGYEDAILVR